VGALGCGGGSDTPVDAAIDAMAPCTHLPNLRVMRGKSVQFGTAFGPRFDGMICVEGRADLGCTMTDFEGRFQVCAPSGADYGLRFKKPGYDNAVYLQGPNPSGAVLDNMNVGDDTWLRDKMWMPLGVPYPAEATHGNVVVFVGKLDALSNYVGLEGASVAVVPSNGLTVRYANEMGADLTLNATTAEGTALIGAVPVGDYDLQINNAGTCTQLTGGYTSPDNSQTVRIPVAGASTTIISIKCTP
jgi:hypothetical protein